ncbi:MULTISPECIES: TetR/AcrR family transcriptional regulator [Rahnella]|jgi:AcrR family transcriptional regulator|uniref:Regulatory protein TetR n=1 Tax=Rahnella sp. (strain Y9602) TaxID=2703885 RepID=A0A0H3FJB4_RAHSY|nr:MULTISPECIES: TetR/AcrR family transcriptional regulator [Rahnella]AFE61088.1 TetR family transcriptional regulator [Rahnella aquatilis HX2]AYA09683.1 TetR/AcrR family transcriptional regulator [Rahnella aquatilis]ADW76411.1 regulatory protein TetR [Rahnella aceris]MBU9842850.1 TetR/AcrR family transcriptional regulator [Rahnella aceris]MBU9850363.1 TetR/AcrR family transcriptional regulator [Rahnella aceris]
MKVRTEARRDAIVDAAAELFQECGYERASMNELARRLGGSKATLYNYFPSKESLLVAVVKAYATGHLSDAVDGLSAPLPDLPLETVLTRFGERMLLVLTNDGTALAVYRMVIAEAGRSDIGMLFHDAGPGEAIESLAAFLALAMQKGQLGNADADLRARQFLALVTAQTNMRLYQSDPAPLDVIEIKQLVKNAVEMFLYGAVR